MPMPLEVAIVSDREIAITRSFAAPRELVWDCHTKPELVRRWLSGPPGWSMAICEIDLRVGGTYRYVLNGPDGARMGWGGVYRDVRSPEVLVATERFDEDWTGGDTEATSRFDEANGGTLVTVTVRFASKEARDGAIATGMSEGMEGSYKLLDAALAELAAA